MIETLNDRQRRWLAAAILVLAILLLLSLTIVPVWSMNRHYQTTIENAERRLAQLSRAAAVGTGLQTRFEQLKRSGVAVAHTLKSRTPPLAGAELQRIVNRVVATSGAELLSTQILPTTEEQEFVRVALKVRVRGTLESIVDTFYSLETGEPFLFLDQVTIRSLYQRTRGPIATSSTLETDFELAGYIPRRA